MAVLFEDKLVSVRHTNGYLSPPQEPHENGPLFTELSFYRRVAKVELSKCQLKLSN